MVRWEYAYIEQYHSHVSDERGLVRHTWIHRPGSEPQHLDGNAHQQAHDAMTRLGAEGWELTGFATEGERSLYWLKRSALD
jgi:hypothetical protein